MTNREALQHAIAKFSARPVTAKAHALAQSIIERAQNPQGVAAVLLYGSGLWDATPDPNRVWDLYVLCDRLKDYDDAPVTRLAGGMMPPNVYYTAAPAPCKFAVMRMDQFAQGCTLEAWKPQIWARFAQPCALIYCRDEATEQRIKSALCDAVLSFHQFAAPFADKPDDARSLWIAGLSQTYASELRSEDHNRAVKIYEMQAEEFDARTRLALPCLQLNPETFPAQRAKTLAMRPFVKLLYVLQLMKASLIFEGGVEYALWKIERHSGQRFSASALQKKYPLIFGWPLLWEIYKAGALR